MSDAADAGRPRGPEGRYPPPGHPPEGAGASDDPPEEVPAGRWPFIYAVVLGVLALDLVVFFVLTRVFS